MIEEEPKLPLSTLEEHQQIFKEFLDRHPYSTLSTFDAGDDVTLFQIEHPWGDPTLNMLLPVDNDERKKLAAILAKIYLPQQFSAIWHDESKDLEVMWTAYELSEGQKEVASREFVFCLDGEKYECKFADSSDILVSLARWTFPKTNPSATNFRNMHSFNTYADSLTDESKKAGEFIDTPRSFWIKKFDVPEETASEFIDGLNFYMSYYDTKSPRVLIHDVHDDVVPQTRYPLASFPSEITGAKIDATLASFWDATRQPNPTLKFIFYYRIIEYAAFHYADISVRRKLRKIISNPALSSCIDETLADIIQAHDPARQDDTARFNALLAECVLPKLIWREIESNKDAFSNRFEFDGGYVLEPLLHATETEATFSNGGIMKFGIAIRKMRNALVHGKDQATAGSISFTPRNMKQLSAWVNAIGVAAGEVVIYGTNA